VVVTGGGVAAGGQFFRGLADILFGSREVEILFRGPASEVIVNP
jgi:hypothetical protein